MANVTCKLLLKSTAVFLLAGCASEPTSNGPQSPSMAVRQPRIPITPVIKPKPPQAPAPAYSNDLGSQFAGDHYFADTITGTYGQSYAVRDFIRHMVRKHGFSENYLNGLFCTANRLDYVIRLESPAPSTGLVKPRKGSWTRYRDKFLTSAHISNGAEFWRDHAYAVERASAAYGVDPEYIVAIIGVETYFGKNIGKTRIFDALTTLAFDTHRRTKFFTSELENFLLMTREEGFDPRQPVGSWAGAMGLGQFMPSSFRKLAVDFNQDGRRDIWNPEDAIGSVAHYFSKSGWRYNSPVAYRTRPAKDASTIELSTYEGDEFWHVHPNFKVIKRYNNSNKYAMAVHQLAQAIKQRYQGGQLAGNSG